MLLMASRGTKRFILCCNPGGSFTTFVKIRTIGPRNSCTDSRVLVFRNHALSYIYVMSSNGNHKQMNDTEILYSVFLRLCRCAGTCCIHNYLVKTVDVSIGLRSEMIFPSSDVCTVILFTSLHNGPNIIQ
jgi:hypothetical protein